MSMTPFYTGVGALFHLLDELMEQQQLFLGDECRLLGGFLFSYHF